MSNFLQYFFYFVLSICIGGILSYWFYYRSKKQKFSKNVRILLFALRTTTITLIILLLLNPKIIFTTQKEIKPKLLLAIDNSKSIKYLTDSVLLSTAINQIDKEIEKLQEIYDVTKITFGESVCDTCDLSFTETETNIASVYNYVDINMQVNLPKAIVLFSDGLINSGGDPTQNKLAKTIPTFSVVLSDTNQVNDTWIAGILHNPVAFTNNKFPLEIDVRRTGEGVGLHQLQVFENERLIGTHNVSFNRDEKRVKKTIYLSSSKLGVHQYRVELVESPDEKNIENNQAIVAIEILDSETKLLLLYSAPSPDIGIIKETFKTVPSYHLDIAQVSDFKGKIDDYKVIIFSQIPNQDNQFNNLVKLSIDKKKAIWFLMGSKSNTNQLNQLNLGWSFNQTINQGNYVYPVVNKNFDYFQIPSIFEMMLDKVPPIYTPFGVWNVSNEKEILLSQRIGSTQTMNPLLITTIKGDQRIALLTGEGLWRWRIFFGRAYGNASPVYDFIQQVVNFLSLSSDTSPFRVTSNSIWPKTANISIESFVYNHNYQLVNNANVDLEIEDANGNLIAYKMAPFKNHYKSYIGTLPLGTYSAKGIYKTDSVTYMDSKVFVVADIDIEKLASMPDTLMLKKIAGNNNDNLLYINEIETLTERIVSTVNKKPMITINNVVASFNSIILILILLVLTTTLEWILRKYNGQI
ncbi:MAG: hypothetical protein PHW19_00565 [Salinivirgaceae bacterium]|nr:hypothetical protein [Salinivirgaceae bacterium]